MNNQSDSLIKPAIEELLEKTGGSNFRLVTLAATRARQINDYHGQLGQGIGSMVPPQVSSNSRKALSISFEEISAGKIVAAEDNEAPAEEETEEAFVLRALRGEHSNESALGKHQFEGDTA